MSEDKIYVEPGVDPIAPTFKEWLVSYGIEPIESTVKECTFMVLAMTGGRPVVGSVGDYEDLSNVVIHGVLGYGEGAVRTAEGSQGIAGQVGPMFHTLGMIDQMIFSLTALYFMNARSAKDVKFVRDYDEQLKHILAHYSGITLATADQMPKGGIIK